MKRPSTQGRYYAVARGYKPGVYKSYEDAKRQVDGFPDAMRKRFKTRKAAEAFVKKYRKRQSATYDSLEDSQCSSKGKYYAVARGYSPGVYRRWEDAKRQVDGFPDAMHKRFPTRKAAEAFVEKYRKRQSADYDSLEDSQEASSSESDASSIEAQPRQRQSRKSSHPSMEYMAPDPSMGKDEKFFSMETGQTSRAWSLP
jgi:viroplasmin and RNaseH domain-containing protein